ncbi:putative targeting protein for XKLP2 [Klebsormidium nitens]|uniref:Putative targeting protein for XKLP2 n=1 Tax=Klebsormidium nitens TaxID=105231 RepID=A0A1Y1I7V6_KLENI|nr:putative targeting protein for XKLP2 [Klebsormidium nitens]|eukprot:GAQ84188.1 putative targeting protein for XKLP2 [Klebsormidium nitens]
MMAGTEASTMDIFQEDIVQDGGIDPAYEFCAPKFFDFSKPDGDLDQEAMQVDTWFDMKTVPDEISPQVAAKRSKQMHTGSTKPLTRSAMKMKAAKTPAKTPLQDRTNMQVAHPLSSPAYGKSAAKAALSQQIMVEESAGHTLLQGSDKKTPGRKEVLEALAAEHRPITRSLVKAGRDTDMLEATIEEAQKALLTPEMLPAKRLYSELQWSEQADKQDTLVTAVNPERQGEPSTSGTRALTGAASRVNEDQERARKKRKVSKDRLEEILGSRGPVLPPRSAAPLTIPHEVHFATEDRAHLRGESPMELRNGKFVSLAESVQKFQSKTPTRFHSKPRNQDRPQPGAKVDLPLTRPVEPQFLTATRVRMTRIKSSAEIEEEELAAMPKFKARPYSDKVRRGENLSIAKPAQLHVTQPEEFHLLTDERAKLRSPAVPTEDVRVTRAMVVQKEASQGKFDPLRLTVPKSPQLTTAYRARPARGTSSEEAELEEILKHPKFKARPLDRRVLDSCGEMGVPKVVPAPTTKPEGFQLATDSRLGKHPSELPDLPARKRQALAPLTREYELRPRAHVTEPEPFPLRTEDRGAQKRADFMQRVAAQEEAERRQREHEAQPLPYTTDYPDIPKKPPTKEPTQPEPFPLESVWRHEVEVAERQRQLEEQARRERQAHQFKAQPNLSKAIPPFVPARSSLPLTESRDVPLETERRAKERAEFDAVMAEKEKMAQEYRHEMQEHVKAVEEEELKALRKEMVPKARPVPSFDRPFVPQRSTKEPTVPLSPPITRKQHRDMGGTLR